MTVPETRSGQPLPEGWRWVKLGDVCTQDRQIVEPNTDDADSLTYYSLEHIESETGRILKVPTDQVEDVGKSATFRFDERHVLYGKLRPYLNKVSLPDTPGRCTTEMIPLIPGKDIDRVFLAWVFRRRKTVEFAMQGKTGSRMPRADMDSLLTLEIPLPPLPVQRRILGVLREQMEALEKARTAAQAQLTAVKALPAAFLRQVFPQPDQPLPDGWRWVRLDDVCEVRLGKMLSPASKLGNRSIPYIRNANVQWNRFDLTDVAEMDFSEDQESILTLKIGDLLVCEGGEPGRAAVWQGQISRCCYQKALHRLRPINDAIDPYFIMYRLWHGASSSEFTDSNAKTTIAHLPAIRLKSLKLAIPPLSEQRRIVAIIEEQIATAEKARIAAEEELAAIEALSGALLRRAFNGEL